MAVPALFATEMADGPGRPVVLSRALGLDHTTWQTWSTTQVGQRPVLAYDQRSHGRSPRPSGPFAMQALVGDAERVIADWRRGPVIFVGLSMGGMVGQGVAIRRPDLLQGLVLAHTTAVYPAAARVAWAQRIEAVGSGGMAAVADTVVQRYLNDDFRRSHPGTVAHLRATLLTQDASSSSACCRAVAGVDWLDELQRIACPTLVLAAALNVGPTPAMAQAIQERIPGARLEVFAHASHLSPLEQPAEFQRALNDFLAALGTL